MSLSRSITMMSGSKKRMDEVLEVEEEEYECNVKIVDNNIYFYCEVSNETVLQLTLSLKEVTKKMQIAGITFGIPPPDINLYINSRGGCVYSALSILDTILNNKVKINTVVSGVCMSAATLISMMGHKRYITPNSYMLIHNISINEFWGKMHEFEDEMKNMTQLTKNIKKIYSDYGNINKTQLDSLLKKDLLLSANIAKKYGFVDEIGSI
jgi:ATP-dependent Clp protease protease subunit